jgi:hypothetical protein
MNEDQNNTSYFAPEVEQAVVSLCWHEPERLAQFYREFDPGAHIGQPHLLVILEAIAIAYGELGTTDFAAIVQIVRELGRMVSCGGLDGLNQVYQAQLDGRTNPEHTEKIWTEYLRLLRYYAQNRKADPPRSADFFTRGHLCLYPNKTKSLQSQPDATGEGKIAGKAYRATAWLEPGNHGQKFFKINLNPK